MHAHHSSICEMNLEAELFTLQDSNAKLVAALHEANANVEQWKKQLAAYQEETERLREQVRPPCSGRNAVLEYSPSLSYSLPHSSLERTQCDWVSNKHLAVFFN